MVSKTFHIREIDRNSSDEIEIVAQRMRATLIEVEGEATGTALYSMDWLRQRVRWHLDNPAVSAKVFLAIDARGIIVGHTIVRREQDAELGCYGLISTTYVVPSARRLGVAAALLEAGEQWMRHQALHTLATWTSSTNSKLINLYQKHGYRQAATAVHATTRTLMVRLERKLS